MPFWFEPARPPLTLASHVLTTPSLPAVQTSWPEGPTTTELTSDLGSSADQVSTMFRLFRSRMVRLGVPCERMSLAGPAGVMEKMYGLESEPAAAGRASEPVGKRGDDVEGRSTTICRDLGV